MGQALNGELASLLCGHSKVFVERRVDILLPGQTWMEGTAETQGCAAKQSREESLSKGRHQGS